MTKRTSRATKRRTQLAACYAQFAPANAPRSLRSLGAVEQVERAWPHSMSQDPETSREVAATFAKERGALYGQLLRGRGRSRG